MPRILGQENSGQENSGQENSGQENSGQENSGQEYQTIWSKTTIRLKKVTQDTILIFSSDIKTRSIKGIILCIIEVYYLILARAVLSL